MSTRSLTTRHASGKDGFFGRTLRLAVAWRDRRASRAALARLDDRLLRDVGLTRSQALTEAGRAD